jgi:hypothetical protein
MVDFSNYPFPTYIPNKIIAFVCASFVFISFLLWIIQSIQNHFQPKRLIIVLFLSHIAIFSELMIRAISDMVNQNSKIIYIAMTVLYTIAQRSIIVANFTYLTEYSNKKSHLFRFIFVGISSSIILSDILITPAGLLSFESNKIHLSFIFRQISTSIICLITLLFYFVWFRTHTYFNMSYETILLLIISRLNCLIIAFFLLIMSIPRYYIIINDDEEWFYFFQIFPIILTLTTWSMLHPKQSFHFRNQLNIEKRFDRNKIPMNEIENSHF